MQRDFNYFKSYCWYFYGSFIWKYRYKNFKECTTNVIEAIDTSISDNFKSVFEPATYK